MKNGLRNGGAAGGGGGGEGLISGIIFSLAQMDGLISGGL